MAATDTTPSSNARDRCNRDLFHQVVSLVRNSSSDTMPDDDEATSPPPLSDATKLRLYGLYKFATVGSLHEDEEDEEDTDLAATGLAAEDGDATADSYDGEDTDELDCSRPDCSSRPTSRPSLLNVVARAKYDAWYDCESNEGVANKSQARMAYVQLASAQDNEVGRKCLGLLREFEEEGATFGSIGNGNGNGNGNTGVQSESDQRDSDGIGAAGGYWNNDENEQTRGEGGGEDCFEDALEELPTTTSTTTPTAAADTTTGITAGTDNVSVREAIDSNKMSSDSATSSQPQSASSSSTARKSKYKMSLLQRYTGIQPLIPRGRLDITFAHLRYAIWQCLVSMVRNWIPPGSYTFEQRKQKEEDIAKAWLGHHASPQNRSVFCGSGRDDVSDDVVIGLSVRSLLDCYLTAKSFRPGTEIILAPCITIPGMIQVMQHHGIKVVPVDILPPPKDSDNEKSQLQSPGQIGVDLEALKRAITSRTAAIMIVHPFGLICTTKKDMADLRSIADENSLDLIEDCAECYTGTPAGRDANIGEVKRDDEYAYHGSDLADMSLFSFGTIKTSTTLGGGIAIIRNRHKNTSSSSSNRRLSTAMRRVQSTCYGQQSNAEYLARVLKCTLLHLISMYPSVCGVILYLTILFGIEYDTVVTSAIRGFAVPSVGHKSEMQSQGNNFRTQSLIEQIRKKPCPALLSLIHKRLLETSQTSAVVRERTKRCKLVSGYLSRNYAKSIHIPSGSIGCRHLHWLYPIYVKDPVRLSQLMQTNGFDAPLGASQLTSATLVGVKGDCARATLLMKGIIYLPLAGQSMSKSEMRRMLDVLEEASIVPVPSASEEKRRHNICKDMSLTAHTKIIIILGAIFLAMEARARPSILCASLSSFMTTAAAISIGLGIAATILRLFVSDDYMRLSTALSMYSISEFGEKPGTAKDESAPSCPDIFQMNELIIPSRLGDDVRDPTRREPKGSNLVLLTGCTGFIGSLLLRELLLHRRKLCIDGVIVLCRPKGTRTAKERAAKILSNDMFSFLTEQEKDELVTVVCGDVTAPNIGISSENSERLKNFLNITHVFHCAASVSFTQSLEDAAMSNITSSLQLQQFTKQLRNNRAKYVYISTAFVHGASRGSVETPLPEDLFPLYPYDPQELYRSMLGAQSCASAAMQELGFPNTYTFSKCVCEHLLLRDSKVSTIIIRPSIVGPAVQSPCEGWAGSKPSTLVAAACLYLKFPYNLWSFGETRVPFIPVDVVCRFVLSKAFGSGEHVSSLIQTQLKSDSFKLEPSIESSPPSSDDGSYLKVSIPACDESASDDTPPSSSDTSISSTDDAIASKQIFTAAWDRNSPPSTSFLWIEYAITITHVGSVFGHLSRLVAYMGVLVTVKLFPRLRLNLDTYQFLHKTFVQKPIDIVCDTLTRIGFGSAIVRDLQQVRPFLDLPLLFFPFTNNSFHFDSELIAPNDYDGQRYMLSTALAAARFVRRLEQRVSAGRKPADEPCQDTDRSTLIIAGRACRPALPDYLWALSQPRGNMVVRFLGWILIKVFRMTIAELSVDIGKLTSLIEAKKRIGRDCHIILAPTHRSMYDFLIISFIAFALPEVGIAIPYIAAAEDFERIPFLGLLARCAGAFFLRRRRGTVDHELNERVAKIKKDCDGSATIEVFIEGSRSRDRRFIKPKTGFVRCLHESDGDHIILPVIINYEATPEQGHFAEKAKREVPGTDDHLTLPSLFQWIKNVFLGRVNIGRVHVSASDPILLDSRADGDAIDATDIVQDIQRRQMSEVIMSSYHIEATSKLLSMEHKTVRRAANDRGCNWWKPHCDICEHTYCGNSELPTDRNELMSIMLHFGHVLAPLLRESHPKWSIWLNQSEGTHESFGLQNTIATGPQSAEVKALISALTKMLDAADEAVASVLKTLSHHGYSSPTELHAFPYVQDYANMHHPSVPSLLLKASLSFQLVSRYSEYVLRDNDRDQIQPLFSSKKVDHTPRECLSNGSANESFGAWGYRDSGFALDVRADGSKVVVMKGDRYTVSGVTLPKLIPFLERESQLRVNTRQTALPVIRREPLVSNSALQDADDVAKLSSAVGYDHGRVSIQPVDRARHGTGHTQKDMFLIRTQSLDTFRLPDAVVWVETEQEVEALIMLSAKEDWCLIPFGGGTNVTHATHCPSKEQEPRPIISVDMRRMNRILWVDEENRLAHVEAGIVGSDLVREMRERGYTIGHEPDSIEFSTLGGWVATKASGMKRAKYGNIEEIVRGLRVIGSEGVLSHHVNDDGAAAYGRVSTGIDLLSLAFGSEGNCGIITSAVINISPLPGIVRYDGIIFASFEDGLGFIRRLAMFSESKPASVRLLDNEQFRLGQALKKEAEGLALFKECIFKVLSRMTCSYSHEKVVCATITYEGSVDEVQYQQKRVASLAAEYGGMSSGSQVGRAGYDLTFAIAYLRDFAMTYHFLAESFETFVPWSRIAELIERTKARIRKEHRERYLPGQPIVSSRITQLYDNGACVYFYFCMNYENVPNPSQVYGEIEAAAREEIILCGGSLSHHHGVGKLRAPFMNKVNSDGLKHSLAGMKESMDPFGIFGARNGTFADLLL